ncbi:hypothetical protein MT418_004440 [Batrachochytrium dendrobatidis]
MHSGQAAAGTAGLSFIHPQDLIQYKQLFLSANGGNASISMSSISAQQVFMQSGLPTTTLAAIWNLCTVNGGQTLTFAEFALGMFLAKLALSGSPLPPSLPPDVHQQVLAASATSAPGSGSGPGPGSYSVSSGSRSVSGSYGSASPNIAPLSQPINSPLIPQLTGMSSSSSIASLHGPKQTLQIPQQFQQQRRAWIITPAEKAQYDVTFKTWDPTNSGYMDGDRAKQVFAQSGLSQNILAHIWSLCDTHQIGKLNSDEFAVAMHIIYKKLNGHDVPVTLPPELVPPSTRDLNELSAYAKTEASKMQSTRRISPSASLLGINSESFTQKLPRSLSGSFNKDMQDQTRSSVSYNSKADESRRLESLALVEAKRKEIATIKSKIEADSRECTNIEVKLKNLETQSVFAEENIVELTKVKSKITPHAGVSGVGPPLSAEEIFEFERLEKSTLALVDECKQRQLEVSDIKTAALRAKHIRLASNTQASGTNVGGDVANKAAALLAARMAALGVAPKAPLLGASMSTPLLGTPTFTPLAPSASTSSLVDEISAVDLQKFSRLQELNEIRNRITIYSNQIRSAITIQKASSGLSSSDSWNPSVSDRVKYEEGVGLESINAISMLGKLKKLRGRAVDTIVTPNTHLRSTHEPIASSFTSDVAYTTTPAISLHSFSANLQANQPFGAVQSETPRYPSTFANSHLASPSLRSQSESMANVLAQADAATLAAKKRTFNRTADINARIAAATARVPSVSSPVSTLGSSSAQGYGSVNASTSSFASTLNLLPTGEASSTDLTTTIIPTAIPTSAISPAGRRPPPPPSSTSRRVLSSPSTTTVPRTTLADLPAQSVALSTVSLESKTIPSLVTSTNPFDMFLSEQHNVPLISTSTNAFMTSTGISSTNPFGNFEAKTSVPVLEPATVVPLTNASSKEENGASIAMKAIFKREQDEIQRKTDAMALEAQRKTSRTPSPTRIGGTRSPSPASKLSPSRILAPVSDTTASSLESPLAATITSHTSVVSQQPSPTATVFSNIPPPPPPPPVQSFAPIQLAVGTGSTKSISASIDSPIPAAGDTTSLLASALASHRGRMGIASDTEDEAGGGSDWGSVSSRSASPVKQSAKPFNVRAGTIPLSTGILRPQSETTTSPTSLPSARFVENSTDVPETIETISIPAVSVGNSAPPPPPPPPPTAADGSVIFKPVSKTESKVSGGLESTTEKARPTPADVGAKGPNLFALAGGMMGPSALKNTKKAILNTSTATTATSLSDSVSHTLNMPSSTKTEKTFDINTTHVSKNTALEEWEVLGNAEKSSMADKQASDMVALSQHAMQSQSNPNIFASTNTLLTESVDKLIAPEQVQPYDASVRRARLLFDFIGTRADDLTVHAGDIISIESETEEWLFCSVVTDGSSHEESKTSGWVPKNFVDFITESEMDTRQRISRARVLYDFNAQHDDDVTVTAGLVVDVTSKQTLEWWRVRTPAGDIGLVPRNYLEELSDTHDGNIANVLHADQNDDDSFGGNDSNYHTFHSNTGPHESMPFQSSHQFQSDSANTHGAGSDALGHFGHATTKLALPELSDSQNAAYKTDDGKKSELLDFLAVDNGCSNYDAVKLARVSSEDGKRADAVCEMIQTERNYVQDLHVIIELFQKPMELFVDARLVFANICQILTVNELILADFEKYASGVSSESIGEIFLKYLDDLECYKGYCSNLSNASELLQKMRSETPSLDSFLKKQQHHPRCKKLDLSSFLLVPMQRVTRYSLLLRQMLHHTPIDHREHEPTLIALQMNDELLEKLNTATKERHTLAKIRELSRTVDLSIPEDGFKLDLNTHTRLLGQRLLLHEGTLAKNKSGRKLQLYLFNDMLLLVHSKPSAGYGLSLYRKPIMMSDMIAREAARLSNKDAGLIDKCCLQIVMENDIITLRAMSVSDKRQWLNQIEAAVKIERTAQKRLAGGQKMQASIMSQTTIGTLEVKLYQAQHLGPVDRGGVYEHVD